MQLFNIVATALTLSVFSLAVSANHRDIQGRHHQGLSRRDPGDVSRLHRRATTNSRWSWYDTETGNAGACGRHLRNSEFVVAMNPAQYRGGNCFKSITLSWRGKTARAQIVDLCPPCPYGGLDLSPSLFKHFTGLGTGIINDGTWWFDGEGPEQPKPTTTRTTTRTSSTRTTTRTTSRTSTRTSTTSTTTSTTSDRETSTSTSTTSTSQSSTSASETSTQAPIPTPTSFITPETGNLGGMNQLAVAFGQVILAGSSAQ